MIGALWLFYFVDGYTVMSCIFVILFQDFADMSKKMKERTPSPEFPLMVFLGGFILFNLFGILFTICSKRHFM